jgi:hypothetical protein
MTGARTSLLLVRWAGHVLPHDGTPGWPEAMVAEVEAIDSGPARLRFAIGCVGAATRERARAGRSPVAVRLVGLTLGSIFVTQAVLESHQWLNGNEASRRTYLLVVAVVVALLTMTTVRLAARRGRFAGITLAAGASAGLVTATIWAAFASLSPAMPRDAGGGLVLIAVGAALAAGLVGHRTRSLRDTCTAGLLTAAVGVALVFATAELTIQDFPGRIPDIVGPVMPAGSSSEQVLRENRIEIVDGYVGLLFLLAAVLVGLLLVSRAGKAAPAVKSSAGAVARQRLLSRQRAPRPAARPGRGGAGRPAPRASGRWHEPGTCRRR